MDVRDRRMERARQLLVERFRGIQADFAGAIGRPANYVSRMLSHGKNRKRIGEDVARDIELKLGLEEGWMDRPSGESPTSSPTTPPLAPRHLALLRSYLSLPEEQRAAVRRLIEALAEAQSPSRTPRG